MANEFKVKKGLIVQGSGSTVLDIQGSQGQLFSVTDSLSGSLFSVSDISGIPILEVFSDNRINLGTFGAEAIKISGSTANITGSITNAISASFLSNGVVSGSSQITFSGISGIPSGLVSGSSQITLSSTNGYSTFSSSIATTTLNLSDRIGGLETSSISLNTYTSSIKTALEFTGSNVTVKGNLTVKGITTTVDSTTVEIGDNIISLNGTGATNAGIIVRDATSPNLISGSLLWDTTTDKWIAGPAGSEDEIILSTKTQTLTNKTINGTSNTITNIGNSSLTNSSITIAGTSVSLGGSIGSFTILSGTNVWSGSAQLPSGLVSGSSQITISGTTGFDTYINQSLLTTSSPSFTNLTIGTNQVLHEGNYNNYVPTKTGTGASGTWGISITGNSTTATNLANGSAGTIPYQTSAGTTAMLAAGTSGYFLKSNNTSAPSWVELSLTDLPDAWVKKSVKVATTTNITLSGTTTIDGVAVVAGDRVLVKNQTTTSQNGIYIVNSSTWTRSTDADTISKLAGSVVNVDNGTSNGGLKFITKLKTTDTLGTTAVNFYKVTDETDLSGGVPTTRTLTINGTTQDLSTNRSWSVGTVTSVGMSVPTGFSISNSPISTSGTLMLSFASGYSLPTTTSQTNWDASYSHSQTTGNPHGTTKSDIGLGNVDNTSDLNKPISTATQNALNLKVDKVAGKQLSTEDYTTSEKNKLAGIQSGAEVNVNADWNATTGDAQILNKPTTFPPSTHTHAIGDVTGLQTALDGKQNVLTNPVTGTGTTNYLSKFTASGTIGNSLITDNGILVQVNGDLRATRLNVGGQYAEIGGSTGSSTFLRLVSPIDNQKVSTIDAVVSGVGTPTTLNSLSFRNGNLGSEVTRMTLDYQGNLGIGITTPSTKLDVDGIIRGIQLTSTIATGTAPLTVTSTTQVANLNADLLDGKHATDFIPTTHAINSISNGTGFLKNNGSGVWSYDNSTYDNYQSWILKTNGVQRTTIQTGGILDLVAGSNVSLSYGAGGVVTINSTDTNTTYSAGTGLTLTGTVFTPTFGTTAGTVAQGNDSRIINGQTAYGWGNHAGLYIPVGQKGTANGVATLDASGLIPTTQLPSYIDDVIEAANLTALNALPAGDKQTGKIYVALDTNKSYRWSGSAFIYITSGAVDSVAGKTGVVTLVKGDVGLGNVDNTSDSTKSVASAAKLTTARTIGGVSFDGTANINLPGVNTIGNQSTTGNAATATTLQTARTLTIGATGKNFDGSANVAWTLAEIGAANANQLTAGVTQTNFDTIKPPGLYQYDGAMTGTPNGRANYRSIEIGSSGRYSQIALPWDQDGMWFRKHQDSTWGTWREVLHSGNYNSFAPTLTGGNASGTWGISITGNAGSVGGYASSALWRSDGGTWNPNANITLNQTANNQEWSFDITRNGFTGGYWHVWDSSLGTMLRVDATSGKVSAPYNFVGTLEGNAATATTLQTARNINGTSFNGSVDITTSTWGTSRTITIGATGKTVDGSGNVSWTLAEIGAQPAGNYAASSHTHDDRYYTEGEVGNFFSGATAITGYNKSNWDTAFGWGNHASQSYATTSYVTTQINNLINGAPGALDTLSELASALGNDASFATTVTNSIASKLSLSGGTMTGQILFQTSALNNGFRWDVNSDAAGITFKNTGDGDNNSYFNFFTEDNGNEYFKFSHNTWNNGSFDFMDVKNGIVRTNGNIYVNASQSGSRSAGTNELINGNRVWHDGDFSSSNISNWNTAYGWGNHASAGYLKSSDLSNYVTIGTAGIVNYIPKFTASGAIGNSLIYDNGTSVGIGTTTPSSYKLNVNGDTNINGTLTATVKSFIIDHPTKPNKKLQYGVLEGPEHSVYFRGKLKGTNKIILPDYWFALVNEETITVNITPIGDKQNIWVVSTNACEIILESETEINCFYTVFAERKDINKLVTEFDK